MSFQRDNNVKYALVLHLSSCGRKRSRFLFAVITKAIISRIQDLMRKYVCVAALDVLLLAIAQEIFAVRPVRKPNAFVFVRRLPQKETTRLSPAKETAYVACSAFVSNLRDISNRKPPQALLTPPIVGHLIRR